MKVKIGKRKLLLGGDVVVEVAGQSLRSDSDLAEIRKRVVETPAAAPTPCEYLRNP